jgi:Arc/MetJ-type ribon-helix-helix transcriptional regulator
MRDEPLTITLSDEEADFVREQVERRAEASPHDVVTDALTLLRKRESDLARLRVALDEAAADPRRYTKEEVEAYLEELFAKSEQHQ